MHATSRQVDASVVSRHERHVCYSRRATVAVKLSRCAHWPRRAASHFKLNYAKLCECMCMWFCDLLGGDVEREGGSNIITIIDVVRSDVRICAQF